MSIETLKQALYLMRNQGDVSVDEWIAAEAAIEADIEQAEKQEPVGFDAWFDAEFEAVNGYVSSGDPMFYDSMLRCKAWALKAWKKATPPADDTDAIIIQYHEETINRLQAELAAERERYNALLEDYHAVLETLEETQAAVAAQRQWVGLTDEEIEPYYAANKPLIKWVEAKLKEKNGWYRQHATDGSPCWCEPEISYTNPETGASVIVHKEPQ